MDFEKLSSSSHGVSKLAANPKISHISADDRHPSSLYENVDEFPHLIQMTEIQAAHAEREAAKLQKELDAVIEELEDWKDKYQEICVELEQTFNEMAGY